MCMLCKQYYQACACCMVMSIFDNALLGAFIPIRYIYDIQTIPLLIATVFLIFYHSTRASSESKLQFRFASTSTVRHTYFRRLPRLRRKCGARSGSPQLIHVNIISSYHNSRFIIEMKYLY